MSNSRATMLKSWATRAVESCKVARRRCTAPQQRTFRPRTRRSRPEAGPAPPRRAPRDMSTYWLKLHDMRFPLRLGETLLGRSPYCSIVLNDNLVSRQHAVVHVTRDG